LEKQDYEVAVAATAKQAIRKLKKGGIDVAVLDVLLPDGNGLDVLERIRQVDPTLPVIFVTSGSDSSTAIQAMKLGALDYLLKPIDIAELRTVVQRAIKIRRLTEAPVEIAVEPDSGGPHAIIGRCAAMQEVYKSIGIVAGQDVTVLIRGESGTGKELVARALYQHGERAGGPFLAVNCAAIPESLLESELFGHEKGAFTGADRKRIGKFEQCGGGTLFLDEIGDMSPVLQSKLLRVLQEKEFERVGGNETIRADVRVIAATHRNLEQMVSGGEFRADLYYRLNGFTIHLPPLRQRGDDLERLVEYFRNHACRELNKEVRVVAPEAMQILREYPWPGNIRELQNAVRQAVLKCSGPALLPAFLPDFVKAAPAITAPSTATPGEAQSAPRSTTSAGEFRPDPPAATPSNGAAGWREALERRVQNESTELYDQVIGEVERQLVEAVLRQTAGDRDQAVRRLGVEPSRLRSLDAKQLLASDGADSAVDQATDQAADDATDQEADQVAGRGDDHDGSMPDPFPAEMTLAEIEAEAIRRALERTKGCRKEAAKQLGISTRTMQRRVKEMGLS
jgi:two-component system nitrogen regulation response regulator GlnG